MKIKFLVQGKNRNLGRAQTRDCAIRR